MLIRSKPDRSFKLTLSEREMPLHSNLTELVGQLRLRKGFVRPQL